jgi:hypothetical protein
MEFYSHYPNITKGKVKGEDEGEGEGEEEGDGEGDGEEDKYLWCFITITLI